MNPPIKSHLSHSVSAILALALGANAWAETAGFGSLLVKKEVPRGLIIQSTADEEVLFYVARPTVSILAVDRQQVWQRVDTPAVKSARSQIQSAEKPAVNEEARRQRKLAWATAFSYLADNRAKVANGEIIDVEPDMNCPVPAGINAPAKIASAVGVGAAGAGYDTGDAEMDFWPSFAGPEGHLSTQYSGLLEAYRTVKAENPVAARVAILDIGFLWKHSAFPSDASLPPQDMADAQRKPQNGKPGEPYFPVPPAPNGYAHGTATAAILAGQSRPVTNAKLKLFSGGNPDAKVIPIRIGHSVAAAPLPFYFSRVGDIARGFVKATELNAEILSMSVGGTPSRALADAVNQAYEGGVAMFCATGDYIRFRDGILIKRTPWYVVYPAAFQNVMGVCGVTAARKPYAVPNDENNFPDKITLGSFGPVEKMRNVIAGWGPNIPWARVPPPNGTSSPNDPWNVSGPWNQLDLDGGGTSCNTPQVASAASLILERHRATLEGLPGWQRVEAIYQILRDTADKSTSTGQELFFGNGFLRAHVAVKAPLPDVARLERHHASVGFYWLKMLASAFFTPPTYESEATLRPALGAAVERLLPDLFQNGSDPSHRYPAAVASAAEVEIAQVIADSSAIQVWLATVPQEELPERKKELLNLLLGEELSPVSQRLIEGLLAAGSGLPATTNRT